MWICATSFRLIHEISGLNVVLDPAVKGTLTIVLDEVPWDQALDIVLQNNGLDKQLNGNVLRIATRDTLKKEAETQRDLEKAQADATTPVTVTRVLSYAKASSLKDVLKKFLSSRGDILSDDRSNQLIIRDIPQVIPTVDNLIRQLDRKSQQVEIEARVVAASRSFAQDIGTELGFAGTTTGGRSLFSGDPAVGGSGVTTGLSLKDAFSETQFVAELSGPISDLPGVLGGDASADRYAHAQRRAFQSLPRPTRNGEGIHCTRQDADPLCPRRVSIRHALRGVEPTSLPSRGRDRAHAALAHRTVVRVSD